MGVGGQTRTQKRIEKQPRAKKIKLHYRYEIYKVINVNRFSFFFLLVYDVIIYKESSSTHQRAHLRQMSRGWCVFLQHTRRCCWMYRREKSVSVYAQHPTFHRLCPLLLTHISFEDLVFQSHRRHSSRSRDILTFWIYIVEGGGLGHSIHSLSIYQYRDIYKKAVSI